MNKPKKQNTVAIATELIMPIINELGLELWDVRFEKEGSSWYLRYFIDKDGGVDITDCENVSRRIDKILDEVDPIEQSYYLEVSSPGIERELVKQQHFDKYIGKKINIRYIRPIDGVKELTATLLSADEQTVSVIAQNGEKLVINKSDTAYIRLYDDYDGGQNDE